MNPETFTTEAINLKARADVATTNEQRAAIISDIERLIRYMPVSFELATKTALFRLVDDLTARLAAPI